MSDYSTGVQEGKLPYFVRSELFDYTSGIGMSGDALTALFALASYTNGNKICFPGQQAIGNRAFPNLSEHARRKKANVCMKELVEAGLVTYTERDGKGRRGLLATNVYQLHWPPLPVSGRFALVSNSTQTHVSKSTQEASPVEVTPEEVFSIPSFHSGNRVGFTENRTAEAEQRHRRSNAQDDSAQPVLPQGSGEQSQDSSRNTVIASGEGAERAEAGKAQPLIKGKLLYEGIVSAYFGAIGVHGGTPPVIPQKVMVWAERIAEKGYTPEQVRQVVGYLMADEYRRERVPSMSQVAVQMSAVLNRDAARAGAERLRKKGGERVA